MAPSNNMGFFLPCYPLYSLDPPSFDTVGTMSASTHKVAYIFQVPKTGNISKLSIYTGTVSGTHTLSFGVYTVDSSGDPTGTAYGGMVDGTISAAGSFTVKSVTLGTAASATKGDIVAAVVSFSSYGGTGSVAITATKNAIHNNNLPYPSYYNGTSWAKKPAIRPTLGVFYDDSTAPLTPGMDSAYPTEVTLTSSQKAGNRFVPSENCELFGALFMINSLNAADNFQYYVETHADKTRVQTHSMNYAQFYSPTASAKRLLFMPFAPAVSLTSGTAYVIGIENQGSNNWDFDLNTGEDSNFIWFEQAANLQTFTNATRTSGSWSSTDHDYMYAFPLVRPL